MKIAYGYDGITEDEHLFAVSVEANEHFSKTAVLGVWLVDSIPMCMRFLQLPRVARADAEHSVKYVPSWFPGASFKRYAAKAKGVVHECVNAPFNEVKRHLVRRF